MDPVQETYLPVVFEQDFAATRAADVERKPEFTERQRALLDRRYDLSDRPSCVMVAGGRKAVQSGVRVKLTGDMDWDELAQMTAADVRAQGLFPEGFLPLPHSKHEAGGQTFPPPQIEQIRDLEQRSLQRFDVEFDLPEHLLPEFPAPIFLTTRPDLGDVSQGKLLSITNYFEIMHGILTPV